MRLMKWLLGMLPVLTVVWGAGTATAQTAYYGPPFYDEPPVNWGGPYVGIEGGPGWGSSHHSDSTGFSSGSFSTAGALLGGTAGYNWQTGSAVVFGVEGDMSWADIRGATGGLPGEVCGGAPPYCSTRLDDLGTARARVGYGFGSLLPFATAGVAFGGVHGHEGDIPDNGGAGFGSAFRVGWAVGAGIEEIVEPNWSIKLEYLHVDLGNGTGFTDTFGNGSTAVQNVSFRADIVRIGINFKF